MTTTRSSVGAPAVVGRQRPNIDDRQLGIVESSAQLGARNDRAATLRQRLRPQTARIGYVWRNDPFETRHRLFLWLPNWETTDDHGHRSCARNPGLTVVGVLEPLRGLVEASGEMSVGLCGSRRGYRASCDGARWWLETTRAEAFSLCGLGGTSDHRSRAGRARTQPDDSSGLEGPGFPRTPARNCRPPERTLPGGVSTSTTSIFEPRRNAPSSIASFTSPSRSPHFAHARRAICGWVRMRRIGPVRWPCPWSTALGFASVRTDTHARPGPTGSRHSRSATSRSPVARSSSASEQRTGHWFEGKSRARRSLRGFVRYFRWRAVLVSFGLSAMARRSI